MTKDDIDIRAGHMSKKIFTLLFILISGKALGEIGPPRIA